MRDVEPLITVIVPTFQRPKSLRRAILSVLNQTFPRFEVHVYDDASNDETREVVSELAKTDSRINYYCHNQRIGPLENFNFGLRRVETPYFLFLSDDDVVLPFFFEAAVQHLNSNLDVLFYAGLTIIVEDLRIIGVSKNDGRFGYFSPPAGSLEILSHQLMWNSVVFRSKVVDLVGVLDGHVGGPADIDFLLRISAHYPIIISTRPSAIYVLHGHNLYARSSDYTQYAPGFLRIIQKMTSDESLSLGTRIQIKKRLDQWAAKVLLAQATHASSKGEESEAYAIAEVLKHLCNSRASAFFVMGRLKIQQASHPAFLLVNWIEWLLRFIFPSDVKKRMKLKQLQKKYGKYLGHLQG